MINSVVRLIKYARLLLLLALFFGLSISVSGAIASKPQDTTSTNPQSAPQFTSDPANAASANEGRPIPGAPHTQDAYMFLQPNTDTPGSCSAPANGGTTQVGCRFVLDLMINSGQNPGNCAHQSYLTYTYQLIQNARVSSIGTSCVPTSTVTADTIFFDAVFQNEACNGPGSCTFRGITVDPGSLAFSSGAFTNDPHEGIFRVARIGICATNPGVAILHWQFSPPAPATRDTEIVTTDGEITSNKDLFTDYVINIASPVMPAMVGHVNWQGGATGART